MDWLANDLPHEGDDARATRAGDLARRDVPTCRLMDTFDIVTQRVQDRDPGVCVVVNPENVVLGQVRVADVGDVPADRTAEDVMEPAPDSYRPSAGTAEVLEYMESSDIASVLITTSDGRLIGLLTRSDLLRHASGGNE
jgi:CBS domain-containing protein